MCLRVCPCPVSDHVPWVVCGRALAWPAELQRRCDTLIRLIERENAEMRTGKKGGASVVEVADGEEDEEDDEEEEEGAAPAGAGSSKVR